jgi:hypothetical protein
MSQATLENRVETLEKQMNALLLHGKDVLDKYGLTVQEALLLRQKLLEANPDYEHPDMNIYDSHYG